MKILEGITQGSDQWRAIRRQHFCASDAAAAMGLSKYKSRSELLREKATGASEEIDPAKQRLLMRAFEKQVVDVEAHLFPTLWWNRIVVHRASVKGWKISPSHFINQDLATIWLDPRN